MTIYKLRFLSHAYNYAQPAWAYKTPEINTSQNKNANIMDTLQESKRNLHVIHKLLRNPVLYIYYNGEI